MTYTFLEFFAGGGMARLGLGDAFKCVFANDSDRKKCETYRRNFGDDHLVEGDVAELNAADIPAADLAWASFPCQDLSLAGHRAGMAAARSGTFWSFWKLIQQQKVQGRAPRVIVIENVTGLLTSHSGRDFAALTAALKETGYRFGGAILDAIDFVPQSRPRLFLFAWDDSCAMLPADVGETHPLLARALQNLPTELRVNWCPVSIPVPPRRNADLASMIETDLAATVWRNESDLQKLLGQMTPLHRARVEAAVSAESLRVGAVYRRIRKGEQRAEVRYDGSAGCLRTLKGGSSRQLLLISEGGDLRLRPMSAREAARLMGLPESYLLPKSATQAISLCGDGVCVPAVAWLSQHVLAPLLHETPKSTPGVHRIRAN